MISKDDIVANVKILDLAKEFNIVVESASSGNFNYRCRCPSINHKNGGEKTSSCYIDGNNNNFYCFGCSSGSNCIDFYMLCTQGTFSDSFHILRKRVNPSNKVASKNKSSTENNFRILLETSFVIRETILNHKDDLPWINKLMIMLDEHIMSIDSLDIDAANKILKSLKKKIKNRYEESK